MLRSQYGFYSPSKLFIFIALNEKGNKIIPQQELIQTKVVKGLFSGVTTVELDNLAAETAATMTTDHADYAVLAARISVWNLHKETKKLFSGTFIIPSYKFIVV